MQHHCFANGSFFAAFVLALNFQVCPQELPDDAQLRAWSLGGWGGGRHGPTLPPPSSWVFSWKMGVHPGRLAWNLEITHLERKMIFQTSIFGFHVNLPGFQGISSKSNLPSRSSTARPWQVTETKLERIVFQPAFFRGYVELRGCTLQLSHHFPLNHDYRRGTVEEFGRMFGKVSPLRAQIEWWRQNEWISLFFGFVDHGICVCPPPPGCL